MKASDILQRYYDVVNSQFLRFILVGGLNTAFGVGVYCLAIFVGLPYFIATLVSNVLGVLFNFFTTGNLVFRNSDPHLIFRFVTCYVIIYFVNTAVVKLFIMAGLNSYWAGILATPVVALCSYSLLKYFVYRKKQTPSS
ncbi:MAG: GtrA family protein [Prevotella sp.]|nr:GtrA family protein [Prevotella sp.]MBR1504844.1 GtrA family protein [Prevotella sp.]